MSLLNSFFVLFLSVLSLSSHSLFAITPEKGTPMITHIQLLESLSKEPSPNTLSIEKSLLNFILQSGTPLTWHITNPLSLYTVDTLAAKAEDDVFLHTSAINPILQSYGIEKEARVQLKNGYASFIFNNGDHTELKIPVNHTLSSGKSIKFHRDYSKNGSLNGNPLLLEELDIGLSIKMDLKSLQVTTELSIILLDGSETIISAISPLTQE